MGLFLAATWLETFVDATARATEARNQGWEKAQGNQCNYQVEPDMDLTFGHFYICHFIKEGVSFVKANCKYKRRKSAPFLSCSVHRTPNFTIPEHIIWLFTFCVLFPDKSLNWYQITPKNANITHFIKKKKPLCTTLNWGNWNWVFDELNEVSIFQFY